MPPKTVSLKRKASARMDQPMPYSEGNDYPYGCAITLDNDELDKLGIDTLPKPGSAIALFAKGSVTSVSASESDAGEKRRSVTIQLEEMAVDGSKAESSADAFYKKS